MATLPSNITVMVEGYAETPDYGVLRTEMDNSIAKQRPRRSLPIVIREVRLKVGTREDKVDFDDWFKNDINGGSGFFTYVDPIDEISKQARFVNGEIRWVTPGNVWFIEAQLETIG
jgi:hypothetical protein